MMSQQGRFAMITRCARVSLAFTALLLSGCAQPKAAETTIAPDYARPLSPGESALRLVRDPARMPDLAAAFEGSNDYEAFLLNALDQSEAWFRTPSSRQFFPFAVEDGEITHEQAAASIQAMRETVQSAGSAREFADAVRQRFDVYESVGYNGEGAVLFTGYYTGVFPASKVRTAEYRYPLYRRPADLVTDPVTGEPKGRRTASDEIVPYYTRREIEQSGMFDGRELVWLRDPLTAYIIHVNGSAKLRLAEGGVLYVGYAGKTDRPYMGLGRTMVDEGLISPENLSLPAIRAEYQRNPERVQDLIYRNENFVFFTEYEPQKWPSGSLGVRVTEEASLATDKQVYPRGGVVLVDTQTINLSRHARRFLQFMLDQDTGGAIKAPGRADIYMGQGPTAEILAGGQYAEGRLYYFFVKPDLVSQYILGNGADRGVAAATSPRP
jgi:membrane-bound lytic murein transglycosylase A